MSSRPDESDDEPAADQKITALVRQREVARDRLAERQQEILEQLHRGLQTLSPSYPQLNAVWMQLRGEWSWVVLVPGEPDYSTAELARALSETGTRLSVYPIEVVEAKDLDLDASTRLIGRLGIFDRAKDDSPAQEGGGFVPAGHARPITKTIVALESPLANPLALPIALAADGVVLCVRRGRDRIKAVRDTVHALGPERILCCVLVE
jgi:hypothetical protein